MQPLNLTIVTAAFGFLAAVLSTGSSAAMPPVEHFGAVKYQTGGVGIDEARAMKQQAHTYPLTLEFVEKLADRHDEYSADEHVAIEDAKSKTVFSALADGPFMLVDLPDGQYTVHASVAGHDEIRHVNLVGKAHDRLAFVWPVKEVEPPTHS